MKKIIIAIALVAVCFFVKSQSIIDIGKGGVDAYTKTQSDAKYIIKSSYTVFLTQTGTEAPVATILNDKITGLVWAYSDVGIYTLTKIGAFTANKTVPNKLEAYYDNDGNKFTLERTSADVMTLKTYAAVNVTVLANGVLVGQYINIDIYR